eukprot:294815-Pyramimonas_sp.AAC.1
MAPQEHSPRAHQCPSRLQAPCPLARKCVPGPPKGFPTPGPWAPGARHHNPRFQMSCLQTAVQ